MKKVVKKSIAIVAIIGGLLVGAVCKGILAFLIAFAFVYIGVLALIGKDTILYY